MNCAHLVEQLEDVVDEDVGDDDFGRDDEAEAQGLQVPRVAPQEREGVLQRGEERMLLVFSATNVSALNFMADQSHCLCT